LAEANPRRRVGCPEGVGKSLVKLWGGQSTPSGSSLGRRGWLGQPAGSRRAIPARFDRGSGRLDGAWGCLRRLLRTWSARSLSGSIANTSPGRPAGDDRRIEPIHSLWGCPAGIRWGELGLLEVQEARGVPGQPVPTQKALPATLARRRRPYSRPHQACRGAARSPHPPSAMMSAQGILGSPGRPDFSAASDFNRQLLTLHGAASRRNRYQPRPEQPQVGSLGGRPARVGRKRRLGFCSGRLPGGQMAVARPPAPVRCLPPGHPGPWLARPFRRRLFLAPRVDGPRLLA
jgi:hypothetical protein